MVSDTFHSACLLHTRRRVLSRECSRHGFRDPPSGGKGGGGARTAIILSFIVVTAGVTVFSVVPSSHVFGCLLVAWLRADARVPFQPYPDFHSRISILI